MRQVAAMPERRLVFDYPTAWNICLQTNRTHHHENCSYRTDSMLCDCAAMTAAEIAFKQCATFIDAAEFEAEMRDRAVLDLIESVQHEEAEFDADIVVSWTSRGDGLPYEAMSLTKYLESHLTSDAQQQDEPAARRPTPQEDAAG
jgi:hypothetical protein